MTRIETLSIWNRLKEIPELADGLNFTARTVIVGRSAANVKPLGKILLES